MSFITFNVNRNHIFFPLLFLTYFLRDLIGEFIKKLNKDKKIIFDNSQISKRVLLEIYILTPSNLFVIFLYLIEKIRAKKINKNFKVIERIKNNELIYEERTLVGFGKLLKLIVLTATFNFIPRILIFFLYFFVNDDTKFDLVTLGSGSIFYIIATSILSRIFLSSYYYKHHFVSLAINIIGLIINIIIDISNISKTYTIILYVINLAGNISYSFASITSKFLLTYVTPYALELYIGLVQLVFLVILFIPFYFIKRNDENIFDNFFYIIDNYKLILLYISNMICICAYGVFIWIIINKFSPNDYALSMMVENMIDKIFEYVLNPSSFTNKIYYSILQIFIFILLIIGICIHNEVIIINKCGLNEYTRDKIAKKGEEDYQFIYNINEDNDEKSNENNEELSREEEML